MGVVKRTVKTGTGNSKKECFGVLDSVFPVGTEGLREVVPVCFDCHDRKRCLQTALSTKEGLELRGEMLDRTSAVGIMGRLKRWSERKDLSRLKKSKEKRENEY